METFLNQLYMEDLERLQKMVHTVSGMNGDDFALSLAYWQVKTYNKGRSITNTRTCASI